MQLHLPVEALFILATLQQHGYDAYIVGGAVRDLLLKKTTQDFDFTTNATPQQIQELFPHSYYENEFGTVGVALKHIWEMLKVPDEHAHAYYAGLKSTPPESKNRVIDVASATKLHSSLQSTVTSEEKALLTPHLPDFEITTYRSDGVYSDHRRPDTVEWGKNIQEDLSRRDFTINAMAVTIKLETLEKFLTAAPSDLSPVTLEESDYELVDSFGGLSDLQANIIRTVGEPHQRFREDALRMLRAVRFSVQLNMRMTDEVFAAVAALAEDIQHVSWERISDEFLKMLRSDYPTEAIELLEETGLLHYLLPELREGKGVEQGGHHTTDVWTHALDALASCPSPDPIVRFATLLHDIAKPRTYKATDGKPTFYNHEVIGARMAKEIAKRFRFSKRDTDRLFILVRYHMFYYQPTHTDAAIRRFMRSVGLEHIDDILDLREADRLGSGARKTSWRLEEMKQRMIDQLHQPFAVTDLAIDGTELMEKFQLKPGPIIGQVLKELFEKVLDDPELNTQEKLLAEAEKILPTLSQKETGHTD